MRSQVYVGGYGKSIEVFTLSCEGEDNSVSLTHLNSCETDQNPAFLDIHGDRVYCIHELAQYKERNCGGVSFMKADGSKLLKLQSKHTAGKDPCHILLDTNRNCVYISNYSSGHFSVTKIDHDGYVGDDLYMKSYDDVTGSGVDPERQMSSHPHGAFTKGRFVYVVDLGCDKIWHYEHGENASFGPATPAFTITPPGSGPRHMVFHPVYDLAFLLTELSNEIIVYRFSEKDGALSHLSSYNYLTKKDDGKNYGGEIMVHPNGKFVYLSNRGKGYLISYKILGEDGKLEKIEAVSLLGTWPRHFNIHSSGNILLCANQHTNMIEVFSINKSSGKLRRIQTVECTNYPACIVFKNIE